MHASHWVPPEFSKYPVEQDVTQVVPWSKYAFPSGARFAIQLKHWSGWPALHVAQGALHCTVTVMPVCSPSISPPEDVRVSSLKLEVGVTVAGFCKFVIVSVKSRAG